ncbi:MAG: hypothetical protein DHS20C16_02800 [Phycisphaerae bacterium]|nr:MAG: hypothetical protein DHS20C16_02800 [Phycisphaerae bacterium]
MLISTILVSFMGASCNPDLTQAPNDEDSGGGASIDGSEEGSGQSLIGNATPTIDDQALDGACTDLSISGAGQAIAYSSVATNLAARDTNSSSDVFVFDRPTKSIERISINPETSLEANDDSDMALISNCGNFVAFRSDATNLGCDEGLGQVYLKNRDSGELRCLGNGANTTDAIFFRPARQILISGDGSKVVFGVEPPSNTSFDSYYVHDVLTGVTELLLDSVGGLTVYCISDNARWLLFSDDLSDVRGAEQAGLLSIAEDTVEEADTAPRLMLLDLLNKVVTIHMDDEGNDTPVMNQRWHHFSGDGATISFISLEPLVAEDTNGQPDVYVVPRTGGDPVRISQLPDGGQFTTEVALADVSTDNDVLFRTVSMVPNSFGGLKAVNRFFIYNPTNSEVMEILEDLQDAPLAERPSSPSFLSADSSVFASLSSAGFEGIMPVNPGVIFIDLAE